MLPEACAQVGLLKQQNGCFMASFNYTNHLVKSEASH